jgi:hypothetical protein
VLSSSRLSQVLGLSALGLIHCAGRSTGAVDSGGSGGSERSGAGGASNAGGSGSSGATSSGGAGDSAGEGTAGEAATGGSGTSGSAGDAAGGAGGSGLPAWSECFVDREAMPNAPLQSCRLECEDRGLACSENGCDGLTVIVYADRAICPGVEPEVVCRGMDLDPCYEPSAARAKAASYSCDLAVPIGEGPFGDYRAARCCCAPGE